MPAGHDAAHKVAPAALKKVLEQGVHKTAPVAGEKVPAEQGAHAAEPAAELCVPTAQGVQVELEEAPLVEENVPTGQGSGSKKSKGQKEPAGHGWEMPLVQAKDGAGHARKAADAVVA